jgi:hypothetical protein
MVYSLCLPLAVVLGYQLTGLSHLSLQSVVIIGLVLLGLLFPILLRWHHPLLIFSWNTIAVLPFLPGRPQVRLALTGASLLITWLMYALDRRAKPQNAPSVTWPLLYLTTVVLVTMKLTGGVGFGSLGSQMAGGGRYVALFGAILGYFALSAQPVLPERFRRYAGYFFLGGLTLAVSSLFPILPQSFYYLFLIFPVEQMSLYAPSPTGLGVSRVYGIAMACMSALFFMLARYGLRGIFSTTRPWRALLFLLFFVGVMFGGYRSFIILIVAVLGLQFYLEGLLKLKSLPVWLLMAALFVAILPVANRLPYQIQRSLAWIPGVASPEVVRDAQQSTEWRVRIWRRTWAEAPQYFLRGKGYGLDTRDLEMAQFRSRTRIGSLAGDDAIGEGSELAGDYHSGPLTILVPFGLPGVIGVVWFWIAGWRLLVRNYRHGPEELKTINTCLLALYCARVFHFIVIFGSLHAEFGYFTGILGVSVALNGAAVRVPKEEEVTEPPQPAPARALRFPVPPPASAKG